MKSLLLEGVDQSKCNLRLANLPEDAFGPDRVHIHTLSARMRGGARQAMQVICKNADELAIPLSLNAVPMVSSLYPQVWDVVKLVAWYKSFKFELKDPGPPFMEHFMLRT